MSVHCLLLDKGQNVVQPAGRLPLAVAQVGVAGPIGAPTVGRQPFGGAFMVQAAQRKLLHVVGALRHSRRFPRRLHRRQQQGDQNADDRNDHQELDKRKAASCGPDHTVPFLLKSATVHGVNGLSVRKETRDRNNDRYFGSRSTPGARRGVKSNGTSPILPCPCEKVNHPKKFQILGEAARQLTLRWGLEGILVPSSVRHGNHAVQQREAAVIGKPAADQPKFLRPSGETTAASLAPTPDFLDYAR